MFVETTCSSFSLTVLILILVLSDVQANSCPHHVNKVPHSYTAVHNHVCYLFVNNEQFWRTARERCWDLGGEMLSIENQETMDFIKKKLNSPELSWDREGVWLGASKKSGRWRWTNGRLMNYTNWAPGQPSNLLGILSVEDCSQMREDDGWKWHDIPCGSLSFHYNYVCQFPVMVTTTTTVSTVSTATAQLLTSSFTKFNIGRTHEKLTSEEYRRLGEEFFQILSSQGFPNSYNTVHSDRSALNKPGDVAGRMSSSSANQSEDNGNSSILAIIISVSTSLLLVMGVIFLVLYYHQRQSKQKASEVPVHFSNNTYSRAPNGSAHRDGQVLPIPTSQVPFASNEELYLDPHSNDKPGSNHVNCSPAKECKCALQQTGGINGSLCSSPATDSELGACGGGDPEQEVTVPLMASSKMDCQPVGDSCATCQSLHSCCMLNQGDYIEMNSQGHEKDKDRHIKDDDEKHTYSNVDHRDTGNENLYEVLP